MGRRKITIQQITDPKLRNITYNKRKNGLIKKAAEIALLCDINLMLVFEDLNGTLVQFSRDPIKSIASFPKECNYKRVLELTADDYPDFSKIKRHKKANELTECSEVSTPMTSQSKSNARSVVQMLSESTSTLCNDDLLTPNTNNKLNFISNMPVFNDFPISGADPSPGKIMYNQRPIGSQAVDKPKKALKTGVALQPTASKRTLGSQKDLSKDASKNKLGLRLNIPKAEETLKDAIKLEVKSSKKKGPITNSSHRPNSSQKTYFSTSNFANSNMNMNPNSNHLSNAINTNSINNNINNNINIYANNVPKYSDRRAEYTNMSSPPKQQQQQYAQPDAKILNLMGASPNKDNTQKRQQKPFVVEEEHLVRSFSEFSPFMHQMVGSTPPIYKQQQQHNTEGNMPNNEELYSTDKIINYLSHPGRSPPDERNSIFTFQQNEMQRILDSNNMVGNNMGNNMGLPYNSGHGGMESEGSSKKMNYWEYQLSGNTHSGGRSGPKYNFDGFGFGYGGNDGTNNVDWNETLRRMNMK